MWLYGGRFVTMDVRKSNVRISGTCCITLQPIVNGCFQLGCLSNMHLFIHSIIYFRLREEVYIQ